MIKFSTKFLLSFLLFVSSNAFAQSESIVLRDLKWDMTSPASSTELFIPSGNSMIAGQIYSANGLQKHPTLLLLHGYPGNERNLDIAQVVRSHGWNVIYFNYRGSWGSQGKFSFKNCVEDVVNVVAFCNKYQDSLKIDTSNIVLFGHSMGGWVCLKALQELPTIKKGFALSSWNIGDDYKNVSTEKEMLSLANDPNTGGKYFVLNSSLKNLYTPVIRNQTYFNLVNDGKSLADKQIIMIDEHQRNNQLADKIKETNKSYFDYNVWQTDHSFTNKRASLINKVLDFLER
jgi:pimeloyl-ACP methyl ester carboxylesterase